MSIGLIYENKACGKGVYTHLNGTMYEGEWWTTPKKASEWKSGLTEANI